MTKVGIRFLMDYTLISTQNLCTCGHWAQPPLNIPGTVYASVSVSVRWALGFRRHEHLFDPQLFLLSILYELKPNLLLNIKSEHANLIKWARMQQCLRY